MNNKKRLTIQSEIFMVMTILISLMAIVIAVISVWVSITTERNGLDENLENIANGVASAEIVAKDLASREEANHMMVEKYIDNAQTLMANLDVISVVDTNNERRYHTNKDLIGSTYDGTKPDFEENGYRAYAESNIGPSGSQRRAYAPVFSEDGEYVGFVMAVILNSNVNKIIYRTIFIHLICTLAVIIVAALFSLVLSNSIKKRLHGYEPDTFSAMFNVRDNVLDTLDEGIVAVDKLENVLYMNKAAATMLRLSNLSNKESTVKNLGLKKVIENAERVNNEPLHFVKGADILADKIPVIENGKVNGALVILRDRTELTRVAEDLSGVKFLVDSMRAQNHEFTNKLHVILGLIQMGNVEEASEYISNLTSIKQSQVQKISKVIEDPSVGALLVGKSVRCAELNVNLNFEKDTHLYREDISLPSGDLVTIIGNLIENALDSLNESDKQPKELNVGIFTKAHAMIINVDDTGMGISEEIMDQIYKKGFSTKGEGRGTGLYIIKQLIDKYNGTISVDSEVGMGSSFTVTLTDEEK